MARNKQFHPDHEPLRHHASLQLQHKKITGPFSFLNPTRASFQHANPSTVSPEDYHDQDVHNTGGTLWERDDDEKANQPSSNVEFKWTSRNNRKGRHAITVTPQSKEHPEANCLTPRSSLHWRRILHVLWLMLTHYPVWDVSWCVAYIFTLGSVVWVINGFFAFLPDIRPDLTFHNEVLVGGGVTAFIGATIFEIGSILLLLEAVNQNQEGCFGWALEQVFMEHQEHSDYPGKQEMWKAMPDENACTHHHANKHNFVGGPASRTSADPSDLEKGKDGSEKSWIWWPSWYEIMTHYAHDLGFIACASQMIGATVFWISGFTALPGIYNHLSSAALDGAYWFPQVLGAIFFVISGALFMVETQQHWWLPAPQVLGWHVGFWNLIGGIGFLISPCFGFDTESWAQYQAACSTFWASWAFLIGSVVQWYESMEKTPVKVKKSS